MGNILFPKIEKKTSYLISAGTAICGGSAIAAISPVIKICANPETYDRMSDDMDINAGKILLNEATLDEIGNEIFERILQTASGKPSCSEELGHQEFILTYKTFEPIGPSCLPA